MAKPAEKDRHCAGGPKIIKPCLLASAECGEAAGAGLLRGPSVPLQWPAFRPRSSWRGPALSRPPGVVAEPTCPEAHGRPGKGKQGSGCKETPGARDLPVLLTFAGAVMDYSSLSDLSFPLQDPRASLQRVFPSAPCCRLRGARRALRLCQRWPWPQQQLCSPRGAPSHWDGVGALTSEQGRHAPSLHMCFPRQLYLKEKMQEGGR